MSDDQLRRIQELLNQVDEVCAESERIRRTIEVQTNAPREYPPSAEATTGLADVEAVRPLPEGSSD